MSALTDGGRNPIPWSGGVPGTCVHAASRVAAARIRRRMAGTLDRPDTGTVTSRHSSRQPIHNFATRLILLPLAVALLSACAAIGPEEPPVPYPASARDRLVRIALAEWEEWGRQFTDHTGTVTGAPVDPGRTEDATEAYPALTAYWSAVPGSEATVARNRGVLRASATGPAQAPPLWSETPWSAAFLSFALRTAGYDAIDVPAAQAHWTVVDHLLARAARWPDSAAFLLWPPAARAPAPGDLLCATRENARGRYASPAERSAEAGRAMPMHCDIVVGVREGVVEAVGGNVGDAVRMSLLPTDTAGILLETAPPGAPALPSWFVVFENRAGTRR